MRLLTTTILALILIGTSGCTLSGEQSPPHIILILADDLGYSDLSCYRERHDPLPDRVSTSQTPHIDRLAEEGMLFTDFYAGAAVCSPSRAALLTGRNCTRVGIYNWIPENQPMHLRNEEITLGEMLGDAGYQTAHFGKWHLTSRGMAQPLPEDHGYGYSFFTYNNADPSHRNPVNFFRDSLPVGDLEGYSCQLVMDEALAWLKKREKDEEPFYINLWFNEPHSKVAAPEELADRHPKDPEYYGCIENMDLAVGRLMEYLETEDLMGETLVICTSDNGSAILASNDPLRGRKAFNYEGGIRVPFLVHWPGKVPAGRISAQPGSFPDVLPTLAAITGAKPPGDRILDGEDLSSVFLQEGTEFTREKPIFFFRYFHDPVCMLREGNWVLLGYQDSIPPYVRGYDQRALANLKPYPGQPGWSNWGFNADHMEYLLTAIPQKFELYNVKEDISQHVNLAGVHPARVEIMKKTMLTLREEMIQEGGHWYSKEQDSLSLAPNNQ